ncbi:hypothetical protein ABG768_016745 [Culter alburnus]|uniref:Uncharacterized protein n=1 Tax=Culter alburnus TaxID=194366 RepID=A0AAW1Z005_CULAL
MKTIVTISLALLSALIVAGSTFEATEGQNITIYFDIDDVETADPVKITFKKDKEKPSVIAQRPWTYDENPPAGVSLLVEKRRLSVTIQNVSISRNSGLYTAQAFFGKNVSEVNAVLVVNERPFSSSPAPPQTSSPKSPNSSQYQGLLITGVIISCGIIIIILASRYFWKHRRARLETPPHSESVTVSLNDCGENLKALLPDTESSPHTCTPKPPDSSDLLWLCALIPVVIVISGVVYFWKRRRAKMDLQSLDVPVSVEETRPEPAQSSVRPCSFTEDECER